MNNIALSNIPNGSKLIVTGDLFRKPGETWRVACYFLSPNKEPFRKGQPIDLLPVMTVGSTYPRNTSDNKVPGYKSRFVIPSNYQWDQMTYGDMPTSLHRMNEYFDQLKEQKVFRIQVEEKVYWLPVMELARRLHFQSSELVRTAFLEGNTWSLARANQKNRVGEIDFTSAVPLGYLNCIEYRKYFTWLFFDQEAENSFCSIFRHLNRESWLDNEVERWSFNFTPPVMTGCEIFWEGFTGIDSEQHHYYVREILAITALPTPPVDKVWFSHPDDVLSLNRERMEEDKGKFDKKIVQPKQIDPEQAPKASKKRTLLKVNPAGLHFDTDIELKRRPRRVQALPQDEKAEQDEGDVEDTVGITEAEGSGTIPRADCDTLEKQELVDAPDKMIFFNQMLEQLRETNKWDYQVQLGAVPQCNCRTVHLIDGRERQYSHVMLQRDTDTTIHILEIELKQNESLSTLLFRSNSSSAAVEILNALMKNSLKWNRKAICEQTVSRYYLDHPDRQIKSEEDALESWIARAVQKIIML